MTHNHRTRGQAAPKRITKKIKIKKKTKNKKSNIHVTWFYRNWVPVPTPIKKSRCTGGTLPTHTPHTKAQFPQHTYTHTPDQVRYRRNSEPAGVHGTFSGRVPKKNLKKKIKRTQKRVHRKRRADDRLLPKAEVPRGSTSCARIARAREFFKKETKKRDNRTRRACLVPYGRFFSLCK